MSILPQVLEVRGCRCALRAPSDPAFCRQGAQPPPVLSPTSVRFPGKCKPISQSPGSTQARMRGEGGLRGPGSGCRDGGHSDSGHSRSAGLLREPIWASAAGAPAAVKAGQAGPCAQNWLRKETSLLAWALGWRSLGVSGGQPGGSGEPMLPGERNQQSHQGKGPGNSRKQSPRAGGGGGSRGWGTERGLVVKTRDLDFVLCGE